MARLDPNTLATMTDAELAETLAIDAALGATFEDFASTVVRSPDSTIEPASSRSSLPASAPARRAISGLRVAGAGGEGRGISAALEINETIGEGGMGIVRLATQRSLGRSVAIKTLRPEARTEAATARLLREAWVTGALEHPNIVPVYDVGLDEGGSPIIILKRIEGSEWSTVLRDGSKVDLAGATDLLEYNLRILVQVCNAVSLAHARGIIHRDLKPENVMIGRFGEVYVVDWGIAVSLRSEDPTGRLPLVKDATQLAGTPAYMAPEMLGAFDKLGVRTDVYLLGAILHELLTGVPPHRGDDFRQLVASILLSTPRYGPDVPAPLAAIAKKAMSRDVEQRFASADELRQRIEWYLRHRGSLSLSTEALRRVDELRALLAPSVDSRATEPAEAARAVRDRVYRLFAEARFGFRQAMVASEDNADARTGLREATSLIVAFELERGTAEGAAAVFAELEDPPADLAQRVEAALRARELEKAKFEELERMGAALDPTTGRRTRMFSAALIAVVWTVTPMFGSAAVSRFGSDWPPVAWYLACTAIFAIGGGIAFWARESLWKTAINRRMVASGTMVIAFSFTAEIGGYLAGLSTELIAALHLFGWFAASAYTATFIERRLLPMTLGLLVAFVVSCARPPLVWWAMAVADFGVLVNFIAAWKDRSDVEFIVQRLRPHKRLER